MNHREPIPCRASGGCAHPTSCTLADECMPVPLGIYDNRRTMRREGYDENGRLLWSTSAAAIMQKGPGEKANPFGHHPDIP